MYIQTEIKDTKNLIIKRNYASDYYKLGYLFKKEGYLQSAELATKLAIELKSGFKEALNNLFLILKDNGKDKEAKDLMIRIIKENPRDQYAYLNLGAIYIKEDNLEQAEKYILNAIEIDPNLAEAHYNLGIILENKGLLKESKKFIKKAIALNKNLCKAYYTFSTFKNPILNKKSYDYLFSDEILVKKSIREKIDIYFARSNILHYKGYYQKSTENLIYANQIKRSINDFNVQRYIKSTKELVIKNNNLTKRILPSCGNINHIFIVGIPRSGSTLIESILSMNQKAIALGESNYLENAIYNWENSKKKKAKLDFYKYYINEIIEDSILMDITIDKQLYNYLYSPFIINQIPNAKIISCHRNPLDNILSLHRTNFTTNNFYSNCLVDCIKIINNYRNIMRNYQSILEDKIYCLNYDSLVKSPEEEIKKLISWLGWEWQQEYLSSHLNLRSVSTASSNQVRYPINKDSIEGWKKYKSLLKPVFDLIQEEEKYIYLRDEI